MPLRFHIWVPGKGSGKAWRGANVKKLWMGGHVGWDVKGLLGILYHFSLS